MRKSRPSTAASAAPFAVIAALAACSQPAATPTPAPSAAPSPAPSSAPSVPEPAGGVVPPGSTGQPYAASRTWFAGGGVARQAWFLCDGVDAPRALVIGVPDAARALSVATIAKPSAAIQAQAYVLGDPDPGAGQIYWPLNDRSGQMLGSLHAFNPGALGDPADAFTPTFTSVQVGRDNTGCRWTARTRLLAVSDKRSFLVTQAPDGQLTYQTFDFKDAAKAQPVQPDGAQRTTTPSLEIKGGQETAGGFVFRNQGYTYALSASPAGGSVSVVNDAGPVGRETLIAWTLAPGR